jgi:hypothetical protein
MVTVSLDSPSCEVTLFDPVSVVYRDATRQAKGLHRLKHVGALERGLAYLSRCNSGWFCHTIEVEADLTYTEHPIRMLDTKERSTRRKTIRMFKIQWDHHTKEEAIWETESYLQHNFPDFFQANLRN